MDELTVKEFDDKLKPKNSFKSDTRMLPNQKRSSNINLDKGAKGKQQSNKQFIRSKFIPDYQQSPKIFGPTAVLQSNGTLQSLRKSLRRTSIRQAPMISSLVVSTSSDENKTTQVPIYYQNSI